MIKLFDSFIFTPLQRHKVNIDIAAQAQHAVDGRAAQEFFPAAARRLTQHELRDLTLAGNLDESFCNIVASGVYDLGPQVFGQHRVFLQAFHGGLSMSLGLSAILEPADQFVRESEIALRLDIDSDEVSAQTMRKPPGVTNDLTGMRARIETDHHALAGGPDGVDAVFAHILLKLLLRFLCCAAQ